MSRVGKEGRSKKRNCCVTCLIINLIFIIIFIAALFIGSSILFKSYVSPHIGGVTLSEALSLAGKLLSGKEAKADYTEEDLDSFYTELSDALFLSDKNDCDLQYDLVSKADKAYLAATYSSSESEEVSAADAIYTEEPKPSSSYDESAAYQHFSKLTIEERFALVPDEVRAKFTSISQFAALSQDAQKDLRDELGLKMYRLSVRSLMEGFTTEDGEFTTDGAVERILTSLDFHFDMLASYDIDNPDAEINTKFNSITLEGKQVSAFINDVVTYLLSTPSSPVRKMLGESLPSDLDLTQYVRVSSVTIMNSPLATSGSEALYQQKNTALGILFNIKLRDMVNMALSSMLKDQLSSLPSFAQSLLPRLVPQNFSVGATIYPLADEGDGREMKIKFNNSTDKQAATLSKLVNGLMNNGSDSDETIEKSFFGELNNKVVEVFKSINEKVKIQFVASRDENGNALKDNNGNTYSKMRIMTVETLVSMIDSSGDLSAHDIFTVLKCLYVNNVSENLTPIDFDTKIDDLREEVKKYGITDTSFISSESGFSLSSLNGLLDHMDLKNGIDYSISPDKMKVRVSAEALASLMLNMMSKSDASESSEESSDSILGELNPSVYEISISLLDEGDHIYSLELLLSSSLSNLIKKQVGTGEGVTASLMSKLLPKGDSYFGFKIYLAEQTDEAGHIKHVVGSNIGENYASKLKINTFSYDETDNVLTIFDKFLTVLGGPDDLISSFTSTIEETLSDLFTKMSDSDLSLNLSLYAKDDTSNGGFLLPSIYELISDTVQKQGNLTKEEFGVNDAQEVLSLVYNETISTEKKYSASDADHFLNDVNEKYYISYASRLTASDLFGGKSDSEESNSLNSKIGSNSIYFKSNTEENALWREELHNDSYVKPALYTDNTELVNLRVPLSGAEVASLIETGGAFPTDMASSFGNIEILGAAFKKEGDNTYLVFDLICTFDKKKSEESESSEETSANLQALFPDALKITAKVLLDAPAESGEQRFSSKLLVNDGNAGKIFLLLKALGSEDLSEEAMSDKLKTSISGIFEALEKNIKLYYPTNEDDTNIYLADIFTALIDSSAARGTPILDQDENKALSIEQIAADPSSLRDRLRSYGKQLVADSKENAEAEKWGTTDDALYLDWANALDLNLFTSTDKDYISMIMQNAYFMKEPNLDNIYTNVAGQLNSFSVSSFCLHNVKDDDGNIIRYGLYQYADAPRSLQINGKALGAMISANVSSNSDFGAAVKDSSMTATLVGLRLEYDKDTDVLSIHTALRISFASDPMMPEYFFVKAVTTESVLAEERIYHTSVSINDLTPEETKYFFNNISSFMGSSVKFSIVDIEDAISSSIGNALGNFVNSVKVKYGTFSADDDMPYYTDTNYFTAGTAIPETGEGYISIPNVYAFFADILFTGEYVNQRPEDERDIQRMLNAMYKEDKDLEQIIIRNPKPDSQAETYSLIPDEYHIYTRDDNTHPFMAYSDTYLAYLVSNMIREQSLDSNKIALTNGVDQMIILRAVNSGDLENSVIRKERDYWEEKFGELNDDHNYLIATITPMFNNYSVSASSGDEESVLPEKLWFTVLIDLDSESATNHSKGMLYNMNSGNKETLQKVMNASDSPLDVDTIANDLGTLIKDSLATLETSYANVEKVYLTYEDSYAYHLNITAGNISTDIAKGTDAVLTEDSVPYPCIGVIVIEASF